MQYSYQIKRRKSRRIMVGNVPIGDGAPVAVQSMTNTETTDVEATVAQIKALEAVGADIVRVSVPSMDAACISPRSSSPPGKPPKRSVKYASG